jgi:SPP1 gp7 family putative phage head morphogenesis protein
MPNPTPVTLHFGIVEPRDAVAAFQRRDLLQPSFRWQDVWQEEHTRQLAVAGVQRLDVLQVFQDGLAAKFKAGTNLADFAKEVRPQLQAAGWWGDVETTDPLTGETRITRFDNRRLQLIYDVNVRQSYAAGQWARIERNKARMPFVIYRTMDDTRVRPEHAAWNNLVLPVDHPFWKTHFPPCGWRCRCKAFAIDQAGIDRLKAAGKTLQFEAPPEQLVSFVNPRTGEVAAVPKGIDPGFAYNPGMASRDEALHEQTLRKAWASSPLSSAVAVAQATFARPEMVTAATARFGQWAQAVSQDVAAGSFRPSGQLQPVTALAPKLVRALASAGIKPSSAVVAMWDTDLAATVAKLSPADLVVVSRLPQLMERPASVLAGPGNSVVMLIELLGAAKADAVLAVTIELMAKSSGTELLNLVRTAEVTTGAKVARNRKLREVWRRG